MSYMLYIDDYAAWSAASFAGAQDLARGYMNGSRPLKIVCYDRGAGNLVWTYDYDTGSWREHGSAENPGR